MSLAAAATAAAAAAAAAPVDGSSAPRVVPAAFAAADVASSAPALATVPKATAALKFSEVTPSQVIKGCWQLSGGHRGDPATDRTAGVEAVQVGCLRVAVGAQTARVPSRGVEIDSIVDSLVVHARRPTRE